MRKYIKEGYDYIKYQKEIDKIIERSQEGRERVGLITMYMATKFPKLPYFWGGGHNLTYEEMIGLDPKLGSIVPIEIEGSKNMLVGELYPKSFDCSGFINWCLINGGFNLEPYIKDKNNWSLDVEELLKIGDVVDLDNEKIKKGDLVWMNGHIGLIVKVDEDYLTIAHISYSGRGTNLTTMGRKTCLIVEDDVGEMLTKVKSRVGQKYFEKAICLTY